MAFVKTAWVDDADPAVTAAQLNRLERGIDDLYNAAYAGVASPALEALKTPAPSGTWVNYGSGYEPLRYFKDPFGIVYVGGMVANGNAGTTLLTLPAGYRPAYPLIFSCMMNGPALARVDIQVGAQAGQLQPQTNIAAPTPGWLNLNGIRFRAEA